MALSKSDQLARYRQRINAAKGHRQKEGFEATWKRMKDLYKGKHFPAGLSQKDLIAVNISFGTINVIVPSTSVSNPHVAVNARDAKNEDGATILEQVVNYEWRTRRFTPEVMAAVKEALITGTGWVKTGYRFVEEEVDDEKANQAEIQQLMDQANSYADANPDLAANLPSDSEIIAQVRNKKRVTRCDFPFVERVNVCDVYVDPEATSMRNARWVAQRIVRHLEDVRADESYKSSARKRVEPDLRQNDDWLGERSRDVKADEADLQRVTVYEFYDLSLGTMSVFPEQGDEFLVDPVRQPYAFGHPFVPLIDYEVPDQFYGIGELEATEPLQRELNMTRTAMFNDRKQFSRAWLIKQEAFDSVGRQALESEDDNRMIPVTGNMPLADAILPVPSQQVNPQLYQTSDIIQGDIQQISGVSEFQRGQAADIRKTATEASIVQDAANSRAAEKLSKVENFISEIARRVVMLTQQYMTGDKLVRVTGLNGQPIWVNYDRYMIAGEYDFEVEAGSTQPRNDTARRQQASQLMQALAPYAVPGGPVNVTALLTRILKDGFGINDPASLLNAPQQPLGAPPPGVPPELAALMGGQQGAQQGGQPPGGPQGQQGPPPQQGGEPPPPLPGINGQANGMQQSAGGPIPDDHSGGGIPPEILAQLGGQVGLALGR